MSKSSSLFNQCNIYTILWIIYLNQGALGLHGTVIMKLLVSMLIGWSIIHMFICLSKYKQTNFMKALALFVAIQTIYGVMHEMFPSFGYDLPDTSPIRYLQSIYISLLPIFSFYYFAKKQSITEKYLKLVAIILIVATIASYYYNMETILSLNEGAEEITNNVGYSFVALLPLLVVFKKQPILQISLVIVCFTFVMQGMKRGAILIGTVMLIYFVWNLLRSTQGKQRVLVVVLLFIAGAFAFSMVSEMLTNSDYFVQRIEATKEGNSSGRDIIYSKIWESYLNETNFIQLLLGRGPNYTVKIAGNYAHQDWLELLCNLGLVGVVVYFYYFIGLAKDILYFRNNATVVTILSLVFILLFLKSMFSMSYGGVDLSVSLCLGACLGNPQLRADNL